MTNDQLDRSFLDADVQELVKQMTLPEKVSLLAGKDWWNTVPVERLNIPTVKVTDGPNGARGGSFFKMTPASAIPSATSLGATFSRKHIHSAGQLLALEAKARGAVCLLAPTINIQRSPLGGRAFESYSEDPTLSGHIAAAYVNGLQEGGVSATIKHFVGNDQEHERMGEDSIISERALREIYLRPFQIAQKDAKPWAYMTSYNKVNGTHVSENKKLMGDIFRKEWGHDGLIMSDWYGTYSVSDSINAGLNLEMPGPARWRNPELVNHLIGAHKIDKRTIDRHAVEILTWVQKLVRLNPDLVYAKPSPERTRDDEAADAKLIRSLGTEGIVLLKNKGDVLPINDKRTVAVIGPNAKDRVLSGGGSAMLASAWSQTPWDGLVANKPESVSLDYALGAYTAKFLPIFDLDLFSAPSSGKPGFDLLHYPVQDGKQAAKPAVQEVWHKSDMFLGDFFHPDLGAKYWSEVKATFTSPIDGEYEFGLAVTGHGRLWVEEELVVDTRGQQKGSAFFNCGTQEKRGTYKVQKGKKYAVRILHDPDQPKEDISGDSSPFVITGIRIGAFRAFDADQEIEEAVALAKRSDTAVIVAGLNADWESEGYDRPDLSLPLRTNELIARVAEANPKTVVVLQSGSAVSMPWIDAVSSVVFAWYGGNETGNAIADIVYGSVNPSGRLPLSFPIREQDIAAAMNYKSARTKIHYEEGIYVGYKHHNARAIAPLFPFGHGLSYSTFEYEGLKVTSPPQKGAKADDWKVEVQVTVKNTGKVAGSHSVHFYTCPPAETATGLKHPSHTLQAFDKVYDLQPGKSQDVKVTLDKYAISHWDDLYDTFRAEVGEWTVKVGTDAQTLVGEATFNVDDELEWRGL